MIIKIKLIYIFIFLLNINLSAKQIDTKEIKPTFIINTNAMVLDFVLDKASMYIATDEGFVEVYDLISKKIIETITVPNLFSTKQEYVKAKILSVDRFKNKTLIVSTTLKGYRNVWIHENNSLKKIISIKDKIDAKEARFVDDNNFVIGTLGHEVILYNMGDKYISYKKHLEQSSLSDMLINKDKTKVLSASESGRVSLFDIKEAKVLNIFESLNVDNIYQIAYEKDTIITAGKDRRVGAYSKSKNYYIKSNFLVYSVALSPSSKLGIYSSSHDGSLQVFNIKTKKKLQLLKAHSAIPTNIKFVNENELFSSGNENKIFYWKLE